MSTGDALRSASPLLQAFKLWPTICGRGDVWRCAMRASGDSKCEQRSRHTFDVGATAASVRIWFTQRLAVAPPTHADTCKIPQFGASRFEPQRYWLLP